MSTPTKPGDPPGEPAGRHQALEALRHALDEESRVRAEAARHTAGCAEVAVWLGASLADLAQVTGHTRQAARKRWPELGPVTRRRRWLSHHLDEILWAARLLVEESESLPARHVEGVAEAVDRTAAAFAEDPASLENHVERWQLVEDLVDRRLRAAGSLREDDLPEKARFACHGAFGVVAHFDHATREDQGELPT